jgi:hypothetical protein
MFNSKLKLANYTFNVLVLFLAFTFFGVAPLFAAPAALAGGVITGTLLSYVPMSGALTYMAVQKEIWQNDIEEQIFRDNAFVRFSFKADEFVNGRAVHIPQSGGSGGVVKNRAQLPANVRKRTDTDVIYLIDEYTVDPVLIPNADTVELSYDKRNSVLEEDKNKLSQTIAEEMLYNWLHDQTTGNPLPATSIIKTTGAAIAATAPGATGFRKAATITDLQRASTFLRNQNRWIDGKMVSLQPANLHAQIFPADSLTTATYMASATEEERRNGLIMKAQGFGIMSRSLVVIVSAAGVIKAPGAASEAGDCEAILCWYTLAVETAYGTVKMFDQIGAPEYYGDLYSFLCRMGGRARRANFAGIVLLVQDTAVAP